VEDWWYLIDFHEDVGTEEFTAIVGQLYRREAFVGLLSGLVECILSSW